MRLMFRIFVLLLLLSPFALGALIWFALAEQPVLEARPSLSHRDIERAKAIIQQNDPRRAVAGTSRRVVISERDLNLAVNYLAQHYLQGAAAVTLGDGILDLTASAPLPLLPPRPYVNVAVRVESDGLQPRLAALRVGSVPVPRRLAGWLLEHAAHQVRGTEEYALVRAALERLELRKGTLALTYRWQPDALRAIGTRLAGTDADALAAYHAHLLTLQGRGAARRGSLMESLRALFALAQERSSAGDPVAENRAALLVLGAWASERGTRTLVPQAKAEPQGFALTLQQRRDLAQHFLVSAALAAGSDSHLSDAVGLFKEVSDSRGGSGFSFTDIAADRAGTRFGELATGSRADALRVQRFLREGAVETDLMPLATDLPEGMPEAEFKRRFGTPETAESERVLAEIERRLAACRLYRDR